MLYRSRRSPPCSLFACSSNRNIYFSDIFSSSSSFSLQQGGGGVSREVGGGLQERCHWRSCLHSPYLGNNSLSIFWPW